MSKMKGVQAGNKSQNQHQAMQRRGEHVHCLQGDLVHGDHVQGIQEYQDAQVMTHIRQHTHAIVDGKCKEGQFWMCKCRERGRVRTVNGIQKSDNPIRSFTSRSGLDQKTRPEMFIGSDSVINISNPKPDNKPEKRVHVIKWYLSSCISLYLN